MTKEELKEWLEAKHRGDRQWLADQCGKSINTVYTWFSSRPIPRDAETIIRRLMAEDAALEGSADIPSALVLHWSKDDFRAIQEAALRSGMVTDEWAEKQLLELARMPLDEALEISDIPDTSPDEPDINTDLPEQRAREAE